MTAFHNGAGAHDRDDIITPLILLSGAFPFSAPRNYDDRQASSPRGNRRRFCYDGMRKTATFSLVTRFYPEHQTSRRRRPVFMVENLFTVFCDENGDEAGQCRRAACFIERGINRWCLQPVPDRKIATCLMSTGLWGSAAFVPLRHFTLGCPSGPGRAVDEHLNRLDSFSITDYLTGAGLKI